MTTPWAPEPKFFEHPRYPEYLVTVGDNATYKALPSKTKQAWFESWLRSKETLEDIADFKNLVPMHIRMNEEEWNWFTSKLAEDEDSHLPNLKALAKHPPAGFKDLH